MLKMDVRSGLFPLDASKPDLDLLYLGGLFDGEGCVGIARMQQKGRERYTAYVSVHMCDREPLDLFAARWGSTVRQAHHGGPRRSPTLIWRLEAQAAARFLRDIQPYLRIARVKEKVALVLEFQAQKRRPGFGSRKAGLIEYREQQVVYFERLRELNRRGPERQAA